MKYVIIGGSAAGVTAAETLRKYDKKAEITMVSDETFALYSRCLLTYLISGAIDEEGLCFKNKDFYKANNIKTYLGKKAVAIDAKNKTLTLEDKTAIKYDKLLIATGASPKKLSAPGIDKKGVLTVRRIDDAREIISMMDKVKQIAVLGGGLIGLRDAYALRKRDKEVTVIVKSPQVLSQMVDKEAADIIQAVLEKNGIKVKTGVAAKEILGADSVSGILLDNGEKLQCQMVIIGKGVNPNSEIASACGLKVEDAIVVDEFLRTSDENIFAAGDVAQTHDIARQVKRVNALWPCAVEQGEAAALNMSGKSKAYDGSLSMNSVDFFGLGCISMGITKPKEAGYEIISKVNPGVYYKKLVLKGNMVTGMVFLGDIKAAGIISILIKSRIDISSIKHLLLEDNFDYAKVMPLVADNQEKFSAEEYKDLMISF
ncbi:MAG: NAD(P)/FAD-dependent oxidoreductase [Candidatus Omnitrophica bacterium]|nr:NAD(P)/FAD-dependent oxidoreductase [Candidatus Omnitrophota bacterium]